MDKAIMTQRDQSIAAFGAVVLAGACVAVLLFARTQWMRHQQVATTYAPPPAGMVFVPAGPFLYGSNDPQADPDERPMREVFLPAFYIDAYEVTNANYATFDATHTWPEGEDRLPVTGISLEQARAYAAAQGKRLPSKFEWEKAARGTDGRLYAWGNEFDETKANVGGGQGLSPVGSYPIGVSPYGAFDMTGNAWEWVNDVQVDRFLFDRPSPPREIIKGGGFAYNSYQCRASYNGLEPKGGTCNDTGFRCAMDAEPAATE